MEGTVTISLSDYEMLINDMLNFKKLKNEKTFIYHQSIGKNYDIYTSDDDLSKLGQLNNELNKELTGKNLEIHLLKDKLKSCERNLKYCEDDCNEFKTVIPKLLNLSSRNLRKLETKHGHDLKYNQYSCFFLDVKGM